MSNIFVLSQANSTRDEGDLRGATRAAQNLNCTIVDLPACPDDGAGLGCALEAIGRQEPDSVAIWIGIVPTISQYTRIYEELLSRNIRLINTPVQHRTLMEFDLAYPLLRDLTPRTIAVSALESVEAAVKQTGLPAFIKGSLGSLKEDGWHSCVADTLEDARQIVARLLPQQHNSRGRVLIRTLAPLKHERVEATDFRMGREFRLFLLDGQVVGMGYYWSYPSEQAFLEPAEIRTIHALAKDAAARLDARYVAVDVGQLVDNSWILIETGDPQFCGLSAIPARNLWQALVDVLQNPPAQRA